MTGKTVGGPESKAYETYDWDDVEDGGALLEFAPGGFREDGTRAGVGIGSKTLDEAEHKMMKSAYHQNLRRKQRGTPEVTYHFVKVADPEDMSRTYLWVYGHPRKETACDPEGACYDWMSRFDA